MKTFLIVIAFIIGWIVCAILSALIGKKFFDFKEEMVVFCVVFAPIMFVIEVGCFLYALPVLLVDWIVYGKGDKSK